jgi:MYXO-CTERM domain-containing protein
VIEAAGGEVDDGDACFKSGGPGEYLREVLDAGAGGDLVWTHATDNAVEANYAHWALHLAEAGLYRVEVYTDAAYAQSHQAGYQLRHAGAELEIVIDQTAADGWQTLGDYELDAGGDQWVHLGDHTGESSAADVQLVFDAVRLTRLDAPDDEQEEDPAGDLEGGCSTGQGGGGLLVLAALGLLRFRRVRQLRSATPATPSAS